jgi:hypothetical protein
MKLTTTGLTIELQPRRRVDDEDWVRVQVLVKANGFRGDFEAWLQLGDLEHFALELGAMHEQVGKPATATLASAEPDIHIKLTMQALGAISGTYALESERPTGTPTLLSGAFEIDQSYLPGLRQSVEALMVELAATAG